MEPEKTPRFVTTRRVEFVDTDMAGIVHFSNFFRYMETAESEFFRSYGFTLAERPNTNGTAEGWPRVSASCSFKSPAYHNEVLEIRVFVRRRGFKSLTLGYEFHCGPRLIAIGQIKTAFCRFTVGQPIQSLEIPAKFDEMLGRYDAAQEAHAAASDRDG